MGEIISTRLRGMKSFTKGGMVLVFTLLLLMVMVLPAPASYLIHNSDNLPNATNPKWGGSWGVTGGKYGAFTCATCHSKTTPNVKRVIDTIPSTIGAAAVKPVYFTNVSGFGNDAGGHATSTHICEVCHSITTVHNYNTSGQTDLNHQEANNSDCVGCHSHNKAFAASCTNCHGDDVASGTPITTGKHGAHVNPGVNVPLGTALGCTECHNKTVSANDKISNPANHMNGFFDYSGVRAGGSATYTSASGVCSASYCHSDGKGTQKSMVADNWKGATSLTCKGCHGSDAAPAFTSVAGEPNYSNLGAGAVRANSHLKHVGTTGVATTCQNCHSTTTTTGTAILSGSAAHVNGIITLVQGNSKSFAWTSATKSCTTISCHGGAVTATWGATLSCKGCHGNDLASGTPIATGKHTSHINTAVNVSLGTALGCIECHGKTVTNNTTTFGTNHVNGFVDYSGARAGKSSTYTSATGVCSAAYCHSDGKGTQKAMTADNWKGASSLTCTGCHGSDTTPAFSSVAGEPNYSNLGAGVTRANSHLKHVGVTGAATCQNCHSTTTTTGTAILSGSAAHVNGIITLAQGNGKSFTWTGATKTCATISCHGGAVTATWGATLGCTGCHGNDLASGTPITTGKHTAHINTTANPSIGTALGCVECHAKTLTNNTTIFGTNHGNGFADYSGAKAGKSSTYTSATGVCSATYCHTDGKGTQKSMVADNWKGATSLTCTGCHGSDAAPAFTSVAGEPNYSNLGAGALRANSHLKHVGVTGAATCQNCHSATTVTGTEILSGSATHQDRTISLLQGNGKSFTWASGTKSCATISCHGGAVTATWGATLDCKGCHGSDLTSGTPIATGKHTSHLNTAVNASLGTALGCIECHGKTVSNNTTISTPANHGNGFADYSGARAGKSSTYTSATGVCSATYCHTDGKGTQKSMAADNWKGATSLTCKGCHGSDAAPAFSSVAGEPNYSNLGPGVLRANSHLKHVGATGAAACQNCHSSTTTTGTAILSGSAAHQNGTRTLLAGNGKSFTWASGTKSCATISCHGGAVTATWGATLGCTGCHGSDLTSGTPIATGKHTSHINTAVNASLGTALGCVECHGKTVSNNTTISTAANHANSFVDYSGAKAGKSSTYTSATGVCSATYCHTDGKGTQKSMTADNWKGGTSLTCKGCHGSDAAPAFSSVAGEPNYSNLGAGVLKANSHQKHVGATGAATCQNCHSATTTNGTSILSGSASHQNGTITLLQGNGKTFTWTGGTKSCATISCHGGSVTTTWGATLGCQDCHGNGASASSSDYQLTTPFFWNNGVQSKIKTNGTNTGWASRGHGRPFGNYSNSGNAAANFGVEAKMCEFCHDATAGHNSSANPFRLKNYSTAGWGRNGICMSCHATGSAGITVGSTTKNRTNSPAISSDHNGASHTTSLNGGQFCWDCHNPHGDSNVYMIRDKAAQVSDRVTSAPSTQAATTVVFHNATTGTNFAKSASPFNGICNVCHTSGSVGHYTATTGDSHNSTSNCTWCHKHNGSTGSKAFEPTGGGDCLACHNVTKGARRVVTTELGTSSTYKSHHVTGATLTKWHCILCHAEGDSATGGLTSLHTSTAGQPVYLRNVDSPGNPGVAGTNYWAISASWTAADYSNVDTFCMKCHDSNGANGIAVNTGNTGLDVVAAPTNRLKPFNDTMTNGYDQVARTRQTDVDTQFTSTNASHHAVKGQRYSTGGTQYLKNASKFNAVNTLNGTAVTDSSTLHCHDCHNRNSHGAANSEYMLQNNAGADALWTTSTYGCVKCHVSGYYGSGHSNGNGGDFVTSVGSTGTARTSSGNMSGIACLNCHNVGATGWGGIHGGNATYTDGAAATQTTYRFMPGMTNSKYIPAGWTTSGTSITCYTAANATWTGCNQHSSGVSKTTTRPARPLSY